LLITTATLHAVNRSHYNPDNYEFLASITIPDTKIADVVCKIVFSYFEGDKKNVDNNNAK
jgi:hypothetical protein